MKFIIALAFHVKYGISGVRYEIQTPKKHACCEITVLHKEKTDGTMLGLFNATIQYHSLTFNLFLASDFHFANENVGPTTELRIFNPSCLF
jgi:hypothetical protein